MIDFEIAKNTEVGKKIINDDQYEPEVLDLLQKLLLSGKGKKLFVDVGSNIGYFPLNASKLAIEYKLDIEIIGFEPLPSLYKLARELMHSNKLEYKLFDQAVSDECGEAEFYVSARSDASNSLNPTFRKSKDVINVPVTTLDALYAQEFKEGSNMTTVLMIDVESFEPKVIKGGSEFINNLRPSIICEVLHKRTEEELMLLLNKLNYSWFRFDGSAWVKENVIEGDSTYTFRDWLFLPSELEHDTVHNLKSD